ncbi:MAG: GNAT family N-acetyltransferase [Patescibacteria group bacterium]
MRLTRQEFASDYGTYAFGYTIHATREAEDELSSVYESGFLPSSSDPAVRNRFYMARSVRIPLTPFSPSSENRRILKKFDDAFEVVAMTKTELQNNEAFKTCFLNYFSDHHGQSIMSRERLDAILDTPLPLRGFRYEKDATPCGYVLEIMEGAFVHYWFSCYTSDYAGTSLGMWLMLDSVQRAKKEAKKYTYVGTAYGAKGRYKMNLTPIEFWNGNEWVKNEKLLKELIAKDSKRGS